MIVKLTFDLPPTLNEYTRTARSSIYKSASQKRLWTNKIAVESSFSFKFPGKVWVSFLWQVKNFGRDPDNTAAAAKFVFDGLTSAKILKNDNLKTIQSPICHWYEKGKDKVVVTISDSPLFLVQEVAETFFNQDSFNFEQSNLKLKN